MKRRCVNDLVRVLSFLCVLFAGQSDGRDAPEADLASGVVVEQVAPQSAAQNVGIQPGDVIRSWSRAADPPANPHPARGTIESPFDMAEVETEQAPRGPVTLAGRRGSQDIASTFPPVPFGLTVRPMLPEVLLKAYREGKDLIDAKQIVEGVRRWRVAAAEARRQGHWSHAAWFLFRSGQAFDEAGTWQDADDAFEEAVRETEGNAQRRAAAWLLKHWGDTFRKRRDPPHAEVHYRRALALAEAFDPGGLAVARSLTALAGAAADRHDYDAAEEYSQRALQICEALAPRSHLLVTNLSNVSITRSIRGDNARAEELGRRALAMREKLGPESLDVAKSLNNLGQIAVYRGDLSGAEDYYRRALAIQERLAPGTYALARILTNLGVVADQRGDLGRAEEWFGRALPIIENLGPESMILAETLNHLGTLAEKRGDLAKAEDHYRRALAMCQKLIPGSSDIAIPLSSLAVVALRRGQLAAAQELYQRALRIREKLVPGSFDEAESLHGLGLVQRQMGRAADASVLLLRALDALETQKTKLGGREEVRSSFAAKYAIYYHDGIEVLVELGQSANALHVLERSRARSLLALLAERDLRFKADLPVDLTRERKLIDAEYDRVQAQIGKLSTAGNEAEIERLHSRLRELREKQEAIGARIRETSPRLGSLQYPRPLDLADVRQALDAGTLFLTYSVGKERTILFAVEPAGVPGPGVSVFSLPVGEQALREKVEAFRRAVERPRGVPREALHAHASELYSLLIGPAASLVATSERLLLSPDGPLHSLPFAALVRSEARTPNAAAPYLIEWKPLHVVASATVFAEIKKARREASGIADRIVAFGDPVYPSPSKKQPEPIGDSEVRSAVARGFALTPLPSTRGEVEDITRMFPGQAIRYLGREATEERAKSVGREARYLHFACHGTLDERFPMNSGLALTIPETPAEGQDNGLLQAWEIFDQVRIDADLVTLSACKTGLGKEMGGEGLFSLNRAFHYAGARSVLSTLWAVSDRSTPLLMKRFYGYLKAGMSRDEALRAAQTDLIRTRRKGAGPDLSHPFRWAAFQLSGDWR
jgi:CHAT domain-containing protein/Tfp pilus assembly protein PilF